MSQNDFQKIQNIIIESLQKLKIGDKDSYNQLNEKLLSTYQHSSSILKDLLKHYEAIKDNAHRFLCLKYLFLAEKNSTYLLPLVQSAIEVEPVPNINSYLNSLSESRSRLDSDSLLSLALKARNIQKYHVAIQLFRAVLIYDDHNKLSALINLSIVYLETKAGEDAEQCLTQVLSEDKDNLHAMFNLASLAEERGELQRANELFKKINRIYPDFVEAKSRYLYANKSLNETDTVFLSAIQTIENKKTFNEQEIQLLFAIASVFDNQEKYDLAAQYYIKANKLLKYDFNKEQLKQKIDRILNRSAPVNKADSCEPSPIFICGLFRSGSTLIEQILSSHSKFVNAGEVDFFSKYENKFSTESLEETKLKSESYLKVITDNFGDIGAVTNKFMDNWLYVDQIISSFPQAKIIITTRALEDNCLAIYFQHLSKQYSYSNDLSSIKFYYQQQQRLIAHWLKKYPDNIYIVEYESVITDFKGEVTELLQFLGEGYEEQCSEFFKTKNQVNTASLWQVRSPIYASSINRWQNYEKLLAV